MYTFNLQTTDEGGIQLPKIFVNKGLEIKNKKFFFNINRTIGLKPVLEYRNDITINNKLNS